MKKFDLQKALNGEALITRDGRKAYEFRRSNASIDYCYFVEGDRRIRVCYKDGVHKFDKQNLDLFMAEQYKEGDRVMVRDNDDDEWTELIYLFTDKNGFHLCTWIDRYGRGDTYPAFTWEQIKPIEDTIEITVKINGKEAKLSDISDETLTKIKEL